METKPSNLDALRIDRAPLPARGGGAAWWIVLLLLLGAGGAAWWFLRPQAPVVKTATARLERSSGGSAGKTLLNASGYVTTRLEATVSSKITGKVTEILVEEGMKVDKGQIVARLDDSNYKVGLRTAEAQLESAKRNLEETTPMLKFAEQELGRLEGMASSRAISRSDLEKAQAEVAGQRAKLERQKAEITVAERQVEDWQQQLDDTIIRAPFAGVVTTKDSQPGEMISPMSAGGGFTRTGICTLVDMASLEIEIDVSESFINRVHAGQPVEATLDAYPDLKIPCKVIAIIPTADRQKATVKVRVAFEKLDPRILPEMGVKVAFQSDEAPVTASSREAVLVPKDAVVKDGSRDIAWVVRDGKSERRAVTVTPSGSDDVAVAAGLSAGETVILNPPSSLADGAAVKIESAQ